ncbi:integrase [Methylovorus sp. MM2]|uniref:phage integrase n=1 Tax=Methylovorus sp. MM2 TaxID=1848038 RepID=UPI0007E05EDE|nr:tyrosine-type recombinase/integrase [Methylovorus sp. MM2]OAM51886.1 integrase [Methylovorus sp. MM2]
MAINKGNKGWVVDIQPAGRYTKRYRKSFATKAEAMAWEAWLKTQVNTSPEWTPAKRDSRKLSDLVEIWFENHGRSLRSGMDTHARLVALCQMLGDPFADKFETKAFTEYRNARVAAGVSTATMNREHAYLRSVFNELKRLGQWKGENPLSHVRQFKERDIELSYLSKDEIRILLSALEASKNIDALLIARVCLSTGARWSEAESLRPSQVRDGQIHFTNTKSGKNRSVPIDPILFDALSDQIKTSKLFGRLFRPAYMAFSGALDRAGIELPKGQMTHVLRHTFASHFMMNGGNILALQRLLGHSNLTMTMRYAHLAPDHLQEARRLNPLSNLN